MKSFWISEVILLLSVVDLKAASVSCPIRNLRVTVDDHLRIYIDGVEKSNLPNADIFNQLDVVELPCDARVIAIHGRNNPSGSAAGILASTDDDYVLTNSSWKCSNVRYMGWEKNDFEDSTWMSAVEFGHSDESYLNFVNGISRKAVWIWMRQWNGRTDSTYEEMDQDVYCRKRLVSTGNDSTSLVIACVFLGIFGIIIIALSFWVYHLRKILLKDDGKGERINEGQHCVNVPTYYQNSQYSSGDVLNRKPDQRCSVQQN